MRSLITGILFLVFTTMAAERSFPKVNILDLKGNSVSSSSLLNKEGLTVFTFWALWCKPCIQELDNISEVYPDWQNETKVKVVAVSIDESRNASKLPTFVNGRGWSFEIMLDRNSELKRALNINNIPHMFIVAPDGRIVYTHVSYTNGDETKLLEIIKKETARLGKSTQPTTSK